MIADTTFLSDYLREKQRPIVGPALRLLAQHRTEIIRTTIISLGEVAVLFPNSKSAWEFFSRARWGIYRLHDGIAQAAADVDRELIRSGQRLGENDNWIAGFCRYYRQPVISRDAAFDRVRNLRRIDY